MKNYFFLFLVACIASCSSGPGVKKEPEKVIAKNDTLLPDSLPADLGSFTARVRDGKISKEEALRLIKTALPLMKTYYYSMGGRNYSKADWIFPLRGYTSTTIGGKDGSGYVEGGYDFFDGNQHTGHPALDIFVNDLNQDGIDDVTKRPIDVLSVSGGIVLATVTNWDTASAQRGGNYIWIFDPAANNLFYYAHNSTVLVKQGEVVKPGQVLAHVGRTGYNAYKKRSPTHLHFMQLVIGGDFIPRPVNPYADLLKTGTLR